MKLEVPLGQSLAAAGCRGCGCVFTGVSGFDRHRQGPMDARVCADPATLGMERKPDGKWGKPGPAELPHFADSVNFCGPDGATRVSSGRAA